MANWLYGCPLLGDNCTAYLKNLNEFKNSRYKSFSFIKFLTRCARTCKMLLLVYFDFYILQYHPNARDNVDICNNRNFYSVDSGHRSNWHFCYNHKRCLSLNFKKRVKIIRNAILKLFFYKKKKITFWMVDLNCMLSIFRVKALNKIHWLLRGTNKA